MTVLGSGLNLFIYYYAAHNSTDCYIKLADILFESNWIELPNDLQKFVLLIILEAKNPIFYSAYSFADSNLETYVKVFLSMTKVEMIL